MELQLRLRLSQAGRALLEVGQDDVTVLVEILQADDLLAQGLHRRLIAARSSVGLELRNQGFGLAQCLLLRLELAALLEVLVLLLLVLLAGLVQLVLEVGGPPVILHTRRHLARRADLGLLQLLLDHACTLPFFVRLGLVGDGRF